MCPAAASAFEGFQSSLWETVSRRSIARISRWFFQVSRVWQNGPQAMSAASRGYVCDVTARTRTLNLGVFFLASERTLDF